MTRDEAYEKASDAAAAFRQEWDRRWKERDLKPFFAAPPPSDWQQPTLHQVLAALEALGVLKFDEKENLDFGRVLVPKGETIVLKPAKQDECEFTDAGIAYRIRTVDAVKALLDLGYVVRNPS